MVLIVKTSASPSIAGSYIEVRPTWVTGAARMVSVTVPVSAKLGVAEKWLATMSAPMAREIIEPLNVFLSRWRLARACSD
jgi:hypothetical protein